MPQKRILKKTKSVARIDADLEARARAAEMKLAPMPVKIAAKPVARAPVAVAKKAPVVKTVLASQEETNEAVEVPSWTDHWYVAVILLVVVVGVLAYLATGTEGGFGRKDAWVLLGVTALAFLLSPGVLLNIPPHSPVQKDGSKPLWVAKDGFSSEGVVVGAMQGVVHGLVLAILLMVIFSWTGMFEGDFEKGIYLFILAFFGGFLLAPGTLLNVPWNAELGTPAQADGTEPGIYVGYRGFSSNGTTVNAVQGICHALILALIIVIVGRRFNLLTNPSVAGGAVTEAASAASSIIDFIEPKVISDIASELTSIV